MNKTTENNGRFKVGNKKGNRFTSYNQPTPEAKKKGHRKRKALEELKNEICEIAFNVIYKKLKNPEELTTKEIMTIFKEAVKMSNSLKQDVNVSNNAQRIFVTQEDIDEVNRHIDSIINS